MIRMLPALLALPLIAVALVAGLAAGAPAPIGAQQGDPLIRVVLPETGVKTSDESFDIRLDAENIETLGAFQFRIAYDALILEYVSIAKGEFLSSTDRVVICNEPTREASALRYECISLGESPPGPSGAGTLATITFRPLTTGTSPLSLSDVQLLRPDGNPFPTDIVDGGIQVKSKSSNTTLYIVVGAVAAGVVILAGVGALAMRRRGST